MFSLLFCFWKTRKVATVSAANRGQAVGVGSGARHSAAGEGGWSLGVVEEAGVGLSLLQTGETFHRHHNLPVGRGRQEGSSRYKDS